MKVESLTPEREKEIREALAEIPMHDWDPADHAMACLLHEITRLRKELDDALLVVDAARGTCYCGNNAGTCTLCPAFAVYDSTRPSKR